MPNFEQRPSASILFQVTFFLCLSGGFICSIFILVFYGVLPRTGAVRRTEVAMEVFGILGFVFGLLAFLRTEKLVKNLQQQGVLDENYKAD